MNGEGYDAMTDTGEPVSTPQQAGDTATLAELTPAGRRLVRTLREHDGRTYLASAARSRYVVVARVAGTDDRYERVAATSARTVGQVERAGFIVHDERRDREVHMPRYSGRRHLDSDRGEPVRLTTIGREAGRG